VNESRVLKLQTISDSLWFSSSSGFYILCHQWFIRDSEITVTHSLTSHFFVLSLMRVIYWREFVYRCNRTKENEYTIFSSYGYRASVTERKKVNSEWVSDCYFAHSYWINAERKSVDKILFILEKKQLVYDLTKKMTIFLIDETQNYHTLVHQITD